MQPLWHEVTRLSLLDQFTLNVTRRDSSLLINRKRFICKPFNIISLFNLYPNAKYIKNIP